jgi:hypothetical protein
LIGARAVLAVLLSCFHGQIPIFGFNSIRSAASASPLISKARLFIKSKLTPPQAKKQAYASSSSGSASPPSFPNIFATTGVSATVGGNLIGDAALCAAYAIAKVPPV